MPCYTAFFLKLRWTGMPRVCYVSAVLLKINSSYPGFLWEQQHLAAHKGSLLIGTNMPTGLNTVRAAYRWDHVLFWQLLNSCSFHCLEETKVCLQLYDFGSQCVFFLEYWSRPGWGARSITVTFWDKGELHITYLMKKQIKKILTKE